MKFKHGILNIDQALPLGLMGNSFALDIELYLSSPQQCLETVGTADTLVDKSYEPTNVSYNMKLLKLDESLIRKYNMIMSTNSEIIVPFSVYRNYVSSQSSTTQSHLFHESSSDIRKMFAMVTTATDTFQNATAEPIRFLGGVKATDPKERISEYNVKVSNHHIYNEPVKEVSSNAVTLKYLKNCANVKDNEIMKVERINPAATNEATLVTNFENNNNFVIGASFIYSNDDNISQGISLNGNPVQLTLTFADTPSVRVNTFMELGYNMHISKGEVTFHEVDPSRQSY